MDQLVKEITPHGRGMVAVHVACFVLVLTGGVLFDTATVPDEVKAELLQRIRTFLQAN